ncbi:uncharacterized protein ARMOST_03977 [Armillaria ostoyae]|uniref:Uncharacterized protein n=1 Tax=Armillaria ostoyae TaxID=47428 RepID=A0A284QW42_ARMOS|nr:uncharacterized protein ARMOST_03977 [Armillaria ostoyae]
MVFQGILYHDEFSTLEANTAIFNILDTMKSVQQEADADLYIHALQVYSRLVHMQWHVMSHESLEVVVNLMFDHYNSNNLVSKQAGSVIARCLDKGSPTMYSVFHALQCLEYFGHHGYRPWLAKIIEGYLFSFGHHSKSHLEVSVIQEHIEYLHTSGILFNVCSILAVGDPYHLCTCKKRIKKNILSLVQIQQNASAWGECHRRLQQLLEEDGMDFFHQQTYVNGIK